MGQYDGLPDYLATAAQKNLRAVDRVTTQFNSRSQSVSTPIPNPTQVSSSIVAPPSSWNLSTPVDTSIGAPVTERFANATSRLPSTVTPINNAAVPQGKVDRLAPTHMAGPTHMPAPGYMPAPTHMQPLGPMNRTVNSPNLDKLRQSYGWGN